MTRNPLRVQSGKLGNKVDFKRRKLLCVKLLHITANLINPYKFLKIAEANIKGAIYKLLSGIIAQPFPKKAIKQRK